MADKLVTAIVAGNLLIVAAIGFEFVLRAFLPALVLLVVGIVIFFGGVILSYYFERVKRRAQSHS